MNLERPRALVSMFAVGSAIYCDRISPSEEMWDKTNAVWTLYNETLEIVSCNRLYHLNGHLSQSIRAREYLASKPHACFQSK